MENQVQANVAKADVVRLQSKSRNSELTKIIRKDELLQDFFKLVHDFNFRDKAHELLNRKLQDS